MKLNLFNDTYIPPIKELPTVEHQLDTIEKQVEVENTSTFSFTQNMVDSALKDGTGTQNGKYRVYRVFQESYSSSDIIKFLKKEYNYYGSSGISNYDGIGVFYSPNNGMTLRNREYDQTYNINRKYIKLKSKKKV